MTAPDPGRPVFGGILYEQKEQTGGTVDWVDQALVLASRLPDNMTFTDVQNHWATLIELVQTVKAAFDRPPRSPQ